MKANLEFVNDKKTPLLCNTIDPEVQRKIIGDTVMNVANSIIQECYFCRDCTVTLPVLCSGTWSTFPPRTGYCRR